MKIAVLPGDGIGKEIVAEAIKVLQALLGHKSAVETWDTYGHLMGDEDDRSRAVIEAVLVGTTEPPRRHNKTGTPKITATVAPQ